MSTDKKKCRIFISHASADANELVPIVDMLTDIYELEKEEITFTSLPETGLANFSRFNETLRKAIQESDLIIIYLTNTYIQREYCLYELGAIWGLNKNCFLINRDGINKDKLPELLLGHTFSKLDDISIDNLVDLLEELHYSRRVKKTADYNSRKKRVLEQISQAEQKRLSEKQVKSAPVKLDECLWEKVQGYTESIEKSAGYTKIGDIYRTVGSYPKHYIMHASARVFNWEGENHFDETAKPHYCLLAQREKDETCQKIILIDETQEYQKCLSSLYMLAQASSEQRIKLSDLLMHPEGHIHEVLINLLTEKGYKVTKEKTPKTRSMRKQPLSQEIEDYLS